MKYCLRLICFTMVFLPLFADTEDIKRSAYKESLFSDQLDNPQKILLGEIDLLQYRLSLVQIAQLNTDELRRLRGAIYAQYGYRFDSDDLHQYFNQFDWYGESDSFSQKMLTDIDRKNEGLIKSYEDSLLEERPVLTIEDMVGIWHAAPIAPSTYAQRFFFNEDRSCVWTANLAYPLHRLTSLSGFWKIDGANVLFVVNKAVKLEGGIIDFMYEDTDYPYLTDYEVSIVNIEEDSITLTLPISHLKRDPETISTYDHSGMLSMNIGDVSFWESQWGTLDRDKTDFNPYALSLFLEIELEESTIQEQYETSKREYFTEDELNEKIEYRYTDIRSRFYHWFSSMDQSNRYIKIIYDCIIKEYRKLESGQMTLFTRNDFVYLSRFYINAQYALKGFDFGDNIWNRIFEEFEWYEANTKSPIFSREEQQRINTIADIRKEFWSW